MILAAGFGLLILAKDLFFSAAHHGPVRRVRPRRELNSHWCRWEGRGCRGGWHGLGSDK